MKFNSPWKSSWVTTLVVEKERKIILLPKDLLTEVEYIVEYIAVQVICRCTLYCSPLLCSSLRIVQPEATSTVLTMGCVNIVLPAPAFCIDT